MKRIIFLILVGFTAMIVSANNSGEKSTTAANQSNCLVSIYLLTDKNYGSTVTYHNGTSYITEDLNTIGYFIFVPKGTYVTINLLVLSGGTIDATDYETRYCAMPITDGFTYTINDQKEIYIRIDENGIL